MHVAKYVKELEEKKSIMEKGNPVVVLVKLKNVEKYVKVLEGKKSMIKKGIPIVELVKLDNIIGDLSCSITYASEDVDLRVSEFMHNRRILREKRQDSLVSNKNDEKYLKVLKEKKSMMKKGIPIVELVKLDNIIGDLSCSITYASKDVDLRVSEFMHNRRILREKRQDSLVSIKNKFSPLLINKSHKIKEDHNKMDVCLLEQNIKKSSTVELTDTCKTEITGDKNKRVLTNKCYVKLDAVLQDTNREQENNKNVPHEREYSDLKHTFTNVHMKENIEDYSSNVTNISSFEDHILNKSDSRRMAALGKEASKSTTDSKLDRDIIGINIARNYNAEEERKEESNGFTTCNEKYDTSITNIIHPVEYEFESSTEYCSEQLPPTYQVPTFSFECYNEILTDEINEETYEEKSEEEDNKDNNDITSEIFTQKNILDKHINYVGHIDYTEDKPKGKRVVCDICFKSFTRLSSVVRHKKTHNGNKQYTCGVCKKSFAQSYDLKIHTRIHTNERPYKCSVCNKTFTMSTHLTKHMRIHTGDKPYKCSYCSKKFSDSSHRNWHMKTSHVNKE